MAENKTIILTFDKDNNFDSVAAKYGIIDTRLSIANNVRWLINCAQAGIHKSYAEGAPRRIEMYVLCESLMDQLRLQLTKEEIEKLKL